MIALALIIILACILVIVVGILNISDNRQENDKVGILSNIVLIVGMCACITICILGICGESITYEDRFPAKDYRIETEITTRGDVSDTTYIITRR